MKINHIGESFSERKGKYIISCGKAGIPSEHNVTFIACQFWKLNQGDCTFSITYGDNGETDIDIKACAIMPITAWPHRLLLTFEKAKLIMTTDIFTLIKYGVN